MNRYAIVNLFGEVTKIDADGMTVKDGAYLFFNKSKKIIFGYDLICAHSCGSVQSIKKNTFEANNV